MDIIKIETQTSKYITGRLSDGSDRQEVETTSYNVTIEDDGGRYLMQFDKEPTEQQITDRYAAQDYINITSVEWLSSKIKDLKTALQSMDTKVIAMDAQIKTESISKL